MKRLTYTLGSLLMILGVATSCQDITEVYTTPARTVITDRLPSEWTAYSNGTGYYTTVNMPEITSNFNATGAVLVYMSFDQGYYDALPQVVNGVSYFFASTPGLVQIDMQTINGSQLSRPGPTSVKIVLVDAEQIAMMKDKGINLKDYNAVQKAVKPVEKYIDFK
ncbi:hypothetical protein [Solitalea lacus]|uniref:hypothetical protein n=1 Tax=Solitalea lacus TaxID=2911172 RepID=UPI001EDA20FA|nr:hypothetical protein [Solitalea lacus]UKJ08463.1 hypothetical protein L2B55_04665 [Solitalea lacus]